MEALRAAGLGDCSHVVGSLNGRDEIALMRNAKAVYSAKRADLQRAWSETSWRMQTLRDNPECAKEEYDRILDANDPGLSVSLPFELKKEVFVSTKGKPRVAILREQGVNGQVEMAAAFDRAGFEAVDVHMTDLITGRASLAGFKGYAAGGGFSYGDVLGGGRGWASTILHNAVVRKDFEKFFARSDTFALGACNGCQMMAALKELVPGAQHWPRFVRNRSEQFEGRLVMVEILESPSLFFKGMAGSRVPIVTAHGEGHALFEKENDLKAALACMRYVDNAGKPTDRYP